MPPQVTSTFPLDQATAVSPSARPRATFSRSLDPTTVTASSVTLTGPGGTAVPATVSYDDSTRSATLTPNAALALLDVVHRDGEDAGEGSRRGRARRARQLVVHDEPGPAASPDGLGAGTGARRNGCLPDDRRRRDVLARPRSDEPQHLELHSDRSVRPRPGDRLLRRGNADRAPRPDGRTRVLGRLHRSARDGDPREPTARRWRAPSAGPSRRSIRRRRRRSPRDRRLQERRTSGAPPSSPPVSRGRWMPRP